MRKQYDFTDAKRAREVPHLARLHEQRDASDLAIIDANAERLNAEALDALDYQAALHKRSLE